MSVSDRAKSGPKPRMTAAVRALRDSAIMAQLHAGEQVNAVAREHGLTAGQVRKIAASFEIRRTSLEEEPMAIVQRALREMEERMRNLALLAAETIASNQPQVALGALKAQADAHERYLELLGDVGQLPRDLRLFRSLSELAQLGKRAVDLVADWRQGRVSADEVDDGLGAFLRVLRAEGSVESSAVDVPELEGGDGDPDSA